MHSSAPARTIAVAPLHAADMAGATSAGNPPPGAFTFITPVPGYFQPVGPFVTAQAPNGRSGTRSGACASRHMAAEQRRRARINERLEALRGLVPHSARANTAAFLTEVYDYITALHKQLERLGGGGGGLDLNVAVHERMGHHEDKALGASRKAPQQAMNAMMGGGGGGEPLKAFSMPAEGEEDSEAETECDNSAGTDPDRMEECKRAQLRALVSAPSLFNPSKDPYAGIVSQGGGSTMVPDGLSLRTPGVESIGRSAFSPALPHQLLTPTSAEQSESHIMLSLSRPADPASDGGRDAANAAMEARVAPQSWGLATTAPQIFPAKKRKRPTTLEQDAMVAAKTAQSVHRPIAVKPQR